jgi:hypothetical protein
MCGGGLMYKYIRKMIPMADGDLERFEIVGLDILPTCFYDRVLCLKICTDSNGNADLVYKDRLEIGDSKRWLHNEETKLLQVGFWVYDGSC